MKAMKPRDRVVSSIEHKQFDRLPIKHLAVYEIDEMLYRHFGVNEYDDLLDILGHDFREIRPDYRGPEMGDMHGSGDHGIKAVTVWNRCVQERRPGARRPMADIPAEDLDGYSFIPTDFFDYSGVRVQCERYADYARVLGYCELDFINGLSGLRGYEQVLMDIATRDRTFLGIVSQRFDFMYEHLRLGLEAGEGLIEFIHLGEDLGTQQGLLLSPRAFLDVLGSQYRAIMDLAHRHGARAMMHVCGSISGMIPTLIDLGLDVLDVVQTNAVGMDLVELKRRFGRDLTFAGTMCVQEVVPFGAPQKVRDEVQLRLELFHDGGLIIGPSHQLQVDSPLENILEMYRAAGGLKMPVRE